MQKTKIELNPLQQQTILAQLNAVAMARGGICLTEQYKNSDTIMAWQCREGHKWQAKSFDIKAGDWCPVCYKADRAIAMTALATKHGGECKSSYVDEATFLDWRCAEGHCWSSLPRMVEKGVWCQHCALQKTNNKIEVLHQIAQKLGEVCLSHRFVNDRTRLLWRCKNGHSKAAVYANVLKGHSCMLCDRQDRKDRLFARLVDLAKELGGDCLSDRYENLKEDFRWRCGEGHEWVATGASIKKGQWCALCAGYTLIEEKGGKAVLSSLTRNERQKWLHKLQAMAIERGGACLSTDYVNNGAHLAWKCANGHEWMSSSANILGGGWCPHCLRTSTEDAQALAVERGGECLSKFVDRFTPLRWRCAEGHEWKTNYAVVAQGAWCPACALKNKRLGIEVMHVLAAKYGGKCLSQRYTNNSVKLRWQCKKGHRWEAAPVQVQTGFWCIVCNKIERKAQALKRLKAFAIAKGGKCLSTSYVSGQAPIEWRCAKGHQWTSNAIAVNKYWCPVCSGSRLTIDSAHEQAAHRAGKCLSTEYIDSHHKLSWQCEFGHTWSASLASIKHGKTWCPECHIVAMLKSRADKRKKKKNRRVSILL
ncbi:hypothetical protein ACFQNF_13805 [Iodobacter arcticus]|uniref:Zinc-ribbon domain-containing protein n=1 Tax=Iodobacter arcticus TaxID=590593 RepID=A0ABW2QZH4_9NEIS